MSVLVVVEQDAGALHPISWEALAGAQQTAAELGEPLTAVVVGSAVDAPAAELASKKLDAVVAVDHPLLGDYTPDGYSVALRQAPATRGSAATPGNAEVDAPQWDGAPWWRHEPTARSRVSHGGGATERDRASDATERLIEAAGALSWQRRPASGVRAASRRECAPGPRATPSRRAGAGSRCAHCPAPVLPG